MMWWHCCYILQVFLYKHYIYWILYWIKHLVNQNWQVRQYCLFIFLFHLLKWHFFVLFFLYMIHARKKNFHFKTCNLENFAYFQFPLSINIFIWIICICLCFQNNLQVFRLNDWVNFHINPKIFSLQIMKPRVYWQFNW